MMSGIDDFQSVFFIGVAGTGMSAIAQYLAGLGKENEFGDLATAGHAERAVLKLLATTPAPGE